MARAAASVTTGELLGTGRVVLFAVPGAYTPGCSKVHLPGFVEGASELKGKGVEFSQEPTEQPYGVDAGFRDPSGNQFRLAQTR